jgi:hypothetical protein
VMGMTLAGARKNLSESREDTDYKFEINESLQNIRNILLEISDYK